MAPPIVSDLFTYTNADWDKIERVVENAGPTTRSIRGRVRTSQLSLREHLTMVAIKHVTLIALFRSPSQRARIRQLEALGHSAPRFYEKLVAALSTDFSFPRWEQRRLHPGIDHDFLDDAHSLLLERLRDNVERALTALRRPTNMNASKYYRDLLWEEALDNRLVPAPWRRPDRPQRCRLPDRGFGAGLSRHAA